MHGGDIHVSDVDGHLGDVPLLQPPADALDSLQSTGLSLPPTLLSDIESDPVSINITSISHHLKYIKEYL